MLRCCYGTEWSCRRDKPGFFKSSNSPNSAGTRGVCVVLSCAHRSLFACCCAKQFPFCPHFVGATKAAGGKVQSVQTGLVWFQAVGSLCDPAAGGGGHGFDSSHSSKNKFNKVKHPVSSNPQMVERRQNGLWLSFLRLWTRCKSSSSVSPARVSTGSSSSEISVEVVRLVVLEGTGVRLLRLVKHRSPARTEPDRVTLAFINYTNKLSMQSNDWQTVRMCVCC